MGEPHFYTVKDGWFETMTGQKFFFERPGDYRFDEEEMALSLAKQCRYNAHVREDVFYSVAEHCCLISDWLLMYGHGPQMAYTGLHHEDSEGLIGDMIRPLKAKIPEFKRIENGIDVAASAWFGHIYPFPDIIKEADTRILVDERLHVMNPSDNDWGTDGLKALFVMPRFWEWREASDEWLKRHHQLQEAMA